MIRPKSPMRRTLAVAAGALIGIAGAVAFAAPASAHHPVISGTGCELEDGSVKVTWTVTNSERDWDAVVKRVSSPSGAEISNIVVGATLPKLNSNQPPLTGEQLVPAGQAAELTIRAFWDKRKQDVTNTRTGKATITGDCEKPQEPTPTPSEPEPTPSEPEPTPTPSEPEPTPSESTTPPTSPSPTPEVPEPGEPTFELQETCDELTFVIENPADGIEFTVTLTSEKGVVKTLDAVPGKTTSVSFDAYEGLKVTPSFEGETGEVVEWTKPADCDSGGGGGDLPLTGAAAGGIAGGALLLLGAGVALYVVARRRRVTFTA